MNRQSQILKEAFSYQDALVAYAYVILQDWNLAEDTVQELFVTVSVKWGAFDSSKALYPWLKRIVRNKAVDLIRKRSREFYCADEQLLDMVEKAFVQEDDVKALERRKNQKRLLKECIQQLGESSRKLISRFYADDKSCAEIANESNRSENAIYISLTRTRQQLRRCVDTKSTMEEI